MGGTPGDTPPHHEQSQPNPPEGFAEGNDEERSPYSYRSKDDRPSVGETGRNEPRAQKAWEEAHRNREEERACFTVSDAQVRLNSRHQGSQGYSRDECEIKDPHEMEQVWHMGSK